MGQVKNEANGKRTSKLPATTSRTIGKGQQTKVTANRSGFGKGDQKVAIIDQLSSTESNWIIKNLRMDPVLAQRAEILAKTRGSTFSQVARQALITFLEREELSPLGN